MTQRLHRKTLKRTDHSHQKRDIQHDGQQNENKQETKMIRKQLYGRFND